MSVYVRSRIRCLPLAFQLFRVTLTLVYDERFGCAPGDWLGRVGTSLRVCVVVLFANCHPCFVSILQLGICAGAGLARAQDVTGGAFLLCRFVVICLFYHCVVCLFYVYGCSPGCLNLCVASM
jgi:hypothetical protein